MTENPVTKPCSTLLIVADGTVDVAKKKEVRIYIKSKYWRKFEGLDGKRVKVFVYLDE